MNDLVDDDNNLYMHCPSSETDVAMETQTIRSEIGRKTIAKSLEQQKQELLESFQRQLHKINSPNKLEILKKTVASLSPILNAACSNVNVPLPKIPKIAHNSKINVQRRLVDKEEKQKTYHQIS
ncbi:hypothetical protein ABEB36_001292 [Hypothenemus hampei]